MKTNEKLNSQYQSTSNIDTPIPDTNYSNFNIKNNNINKKIFENNINTNDIEQKRLENEDKDKDRELYKFDKIKTILYWCISFLIILIGVDILLNYYISKNNINNFNSKEITTGIEVLKALIFTISGYLFSKKDN